MEGLKQRTYSDVCGVQWGSCWECLPNVQPWDSRIAQSRDVIWLGRMYHYHTRQDANLMQQLPIVTVPISIHDASVRQWMPFWLPLLPADKPTSIKHRGQCKYIDFYINLLNLTKPFNSGLKKWMRKAARHSGGVVSLNPRRWRGERLHHHGGGVCWLFVLLWMDLWCHETIVCKKMVQK